MTTWSLAMIVKNEAAVLARCLDSIKEIVDEIIIVDTGSTDETVEIAKLYTDKVFHFDWINDFAAARNFSFSKATCDYIMWLDADDFFADSERKKLLEYKKNFNPELDVAYLKYNVGFDAQGNVTLSNYRERILKRSRNFQWSEPVHECIVVSGPTEHVDIAVTHGAKNRTHTHRNLEIYESQTTLTDRGTFYYARELKTHNRLQEAIVKYTLFLDNQRGWREDNIRSCYDLADCYKHLEQPETAVKYLFQTFLYDKPRAETCCKIGDYFFEKRDYHNATYWYDLALNPNSHFEAGFFNPDYCDFIPSIQLCIIFDRLGNHELAYDYHLKTKKMKPDHPSVKYNDNYFEKLFSTKETFKEGV